MKRLRIYNADLMETLLASKSSRKETADVDGDEVSSEEHSLDIRNGNHVDEMDNGDGNDHVEQNDVEKMEASAATNSVWNSLSAQDLARCFFLLTTTQSKSAVNRYFDCDDVAKEYQLKKILINSLGITRVIFCVQCGEAKERCNCESGFNEGEIVYSNMQTKINSFVTFFGDRVVRTQQQILEGITVSSPMAHGLLKQLLRSGNERLDLHFTCGFDGIRLKGNTKRKVWPFTIINLDVDDLARSKPDCVLLCAVYLGHQDPSYKIHDRIVTWVINELATASDWNGRKVQGHIVTCNHDDQARRKIYNLKAHSSAGACPFCLDQGTIVKSYPNGTIDRESVGTNVPHFLQDGLRQEAVYSGFNRVIPMWNCPIDMFHCFEEGIFDRFITEILSNKGKIAVFANTSLTDELRNRLFAMDHPSFMRRLSGNISDITGSEKAVIFETVIVPCAFAGLLHPIAACLAVAFHAIYRLMMSPDSVDNAHLSIQIRTLCESISPIIQQNCIELLTGSKVHQVLFHLAQCVEKYGSLAPLSTQLHEHYYHVLQRLLIPEITNGIGTTLIRNSSAILDLKAAFQRRLEENPLLVSTCIYSKKLAKAMGIDAKLYEMTTATSVPDRILPFMQTGDLFTPTYFVQGRRYSCHKNGRSNDSVFMYFHLGYIMTMTDRSKYSTSAKPQEPQISLPARFINKPLDLLIPALQMNYDVCTNSMEVTVSLIFSRHLNYLFTHARTLVKESSEGAPSRKSSRSGSKDDTLIRSVPSRGHQEEPSLLSPANIAYSPVKTKIRKMPGIPNACGTPSRIRTISGSFKTIHSACEAGAAASYHPVPVKMVDNTHVPMTQPQSLYQKFLDWSHREHHFKLAHIFDSNNH